MAPILSTLIKFFLFLFLNHTNASSTSRSTGFTTDFIHRDFSPLSPLYDPSLTQFDRLNNTIHRSFSRASTLSASLNTFQSPITSTIGEYLMNISIGTPPFTILALVDTGSDLIWTQCKPCTNCFNQTYPLFNPQNSFTHTKIPCNSPLCTNSPCRSTNNKICNYTYNYADGSFTSGEFALDTFTFKTTNTNFPISFPNVSFGCGHDNIGYSFQNISSGIIGLGAGSTSLISQIDSINGRFSYCLFPINSQIAYTSKISFGTDAVVSGPGVVTTPLTIKSPNPSSVFYFINLERISVGKHNFKYKGSRPVSSTKGNIIIDSGTTLTYLPTKMYDNLVSLVMQSVNAEPVEDRKGSFKLCYEFREYEKIPTVIFHFSGGADVELPPWATFHKVWDGMVCLTIEPTRGLAVFGNFHQVNLLVGYDIWNYTVSFKRTDCTRKFQQ